MRALIPFLIVTVTTVVAQNRPTATASIALTARLPGSITLSDNVITTQIIVKDGFAQAVSVPILLEWNLNPRETQSFQLLARLSPAPYAEAVTAANDVSTSRAFPASDRPLVLLNIPITVATRQGKQRHKLILSFDQQALPRMPDGTYPVTLYLSTRQQ